MKINQEINEPATLKLNMGNTNNLHPAFCFRHLHDDFNFKQLILTEEKYAKNFIEKLDKLSKMSWKEIMNSSRYKNGTEIIDRKQIEYSISKEITQDMNILAFHLQDLLD